METDQIQARYPTGCPAWCQIEDHLDFTGNPDIHATWHTLDLSLHPDGLDPDGTVHYANVKAGLDLGPADFAFHAGRPRVTLVVDEAPDGNVIEMTLAEAGTLGAQLAELVTRASGGKP